LMIERVRSMAMVVLEFIDKNDFFAVLQSL
jgi:hypothetical protein